MAKHNGEYIGRLLIVQHGKEKIKGLVIGYKNKSYEVEWYLEDRIFNSIYNISTIKSWLELTEIAIRKMK